MDIAITFCVLGGITCAALASARRRSVLGWLGIGALFPILGVILILVLPVGYEPSYRALPPPDAGPYERMSNTVIAQRTHLQNTTLDAVHRLTELRDHGQLTDLEFAEKRAELLARV